MSSEPATPDLDPQVAAAIARAERRREMLEQLAGMGMALAKEITVRWIDGPYHPEPKHDPGLSFAQVSRAVRLTLTLEAKVDELILALRKNGLDALKTVAPAPRQDSTRRERARDAAEDAADGDAVEATGGRLEHESERLVEGEEDAALLADTFRNQVAVICDSFGVEPDWSCWSDEEGFIRDDGAPVTEWVSKYDVRDPDEEGARQDLLRNVKFLPEGKPGPRLGPHPRE